MKFKNVQDLSAWRLCVGCGACSYICPEKNISLGNVVREGIRPRIKESHCRECGECLKVCPGINSSHMFGSKNYEFLPELLSGWGPVFSFWEGFAADTEIRYNGSSGGIASALSLYCLEKENMEGVLHIGPHESLPLENSTVFSTTRSQILARTGSRYSPASPCDGLGRIQTADGLCVFVGKPCDVLGLRKSQELQPDLDRKVGVSIGIFCAGTPALQGTIDLLERKGIEPTAVAELRYRGRGWPGKFAVSLRGGNTCQELATYQDAWGFIQKYRPYRCYLCPDSTSEFADISCGDPWYRNPQEGEAGSSLVLARTQKGREIVEGAIKGGYVILEKRDPQLLEKSQLNLLAKRRAIWGRLIAMKAFGVPTPRLRGFHLFENWQRLSTKEKIRSVVGTARRIVQRRYYKPTETFD